MIITYLGKQFFKIQQGETSIAINPISKDSKSGIKGSRFGADIVLSTTNHPDYNGIETVTYGDREPVSIIGPGDYEVRDIFIKGMLTRTKLGDTNYINTIYNIVLEGVTIVMLGALGQKLETAEREGIQNPDILFVPVGGELLDVATAYKTAVSLEPKIIIPMDYDEKSLQAFLKEAGVGKITSIDKLVLKKKDLQDKQGEVVVLSF